MTKEIEKLISSVSGPEAASPHRKSIKESIMNEFEINTSPAQRKRRKLTHWAPRVTATSAALAIVAVFGFSTFVAGPLTAKEVLAQASEQYSESNISEGRYLYTKSKNISSFNGQENVTIQELWLDLETNDSRSVTSLEDGTVLDTFLTVGDKSYSYFNEQAFENLSPVEEGAGTISISLSGEEMSEDISFDEFDISTGIEGADEAGLSDDELMSLSMNDIDDRLEAAGFARHNQELYGTADFDAYTMSAEELQEFSESIFGNLEADGAINLDISEEDIQKLNSIWPEEFSGDNATTSFVDVASPISAGTISAGASALEIGDGDLGQIADFYGKIEKLTKASSAQERLALLDELRDDESVELTDEMEWYGQQVVGISFKNDVFGDSSVMYFNTETFRMAGSESSFSFDGIDNSFANIVLEEKFSDERPDFSTDGLTELTFNLNEALPVHSIDGGNATIIDLDTEGSDTAAPTSGSVHLEDVLQQ